MNMEKTKDEIRDLYYLYIYRGKGIRNLASKLGVKRVDVVNLFNDNGLMTRNQILAEEPRSIKIGGKWIATSYNLFHETYLGAKFINFMSLYPSLEEIQQTTKDLVDEKNEYYSKFEDVLFREKMNTVK